MALLLDAPGWQNAQQQAQQHDAQPSALGSIRLVIFASGQQQQVETTVVADMAVTLPSGQSCL